MPPWVFGVQTNHTGWYQRRNNINNQQSTGWNWDFFCHFWTHFTSTLTSSPPVRPDIIILKNWIELKLEFAIKCDSAGNSMWVCLVWSWWVFVNGAAKNTRTQRGLLLSWGGEWEVIPVIIIETIIIIHFNKVYCEFCCSHSSAELRSCGHCGQCCAVLCCWSTRVWVVDEGLEWNGSQEKESETDLHNSDGNVCLIAIYHQVCNVFC